MPHFLQIFERKKSRPQSSCSSNKPNNTDNHSNCGSHSHLGSQSDTNTDSDGTSSVNTRQPSIATINEPPAPLPPLKHTRSNASTSSHTSMASRSSRVRHQDVRRIEVFDDGSHQHHLKNARRQEKLTRMIQTMMGSAKGSDAVSALPDIIKEANTEDPSAVHNLVKSCSPPEKLSLMSGLLTKVEAGEMELGLVNGASTGATKKQHAGRPSRPPKEDEGSSGSNNNCNGNNELKHVESRQSLVEKYGRCQEIIGKGSYGVVRVCHKQDDVGRVQLFAVKEFKKRSIESHEVFEERLLSEFCIASSLKHHNIISTIDLMRSGSGLCYEIMEYCAGGDLYSLILSSGHGLTEVESNCFFKQILRGVNYMHSMGIAHCDLKPENVLLGPDGVCKISDFGNGECFRMAWEKCVHLSSGVYGSGPYIAPEEFKNKPFDPRAVDIWATGIIYMVMRTGSYLWRTAECDKDEDFYEYVHARKTEKGYAPIETLAPSKCVYVIYSILDPVPSRRLTGKQVLNSEWGRSIKVCRPGEPAKCTTPCERESNVGVGAGSGIGTAAGSGIGGGIGVLSQAQLARNAAAPAVGESIY